MIFENAPTYLIASLIAMAIWLALYLHRKDLRKEMFVVSSIVALLGLYMEAFFWTKDWWRPPTITGTVIGIEDLLFGFAFGGIAAVVYEEIFKRKLSRQIVAERNHRVHLLIVLGLSVSIGLIGQFVLGLTSANTWMLAIGAPTVVMLCIRRDLITNSLATGAILTLIAFVVFSILNFIEPGFVYSWWLFENLSGTIVLGVPLEDVIWFFTAGAFLGPVYEFWNRRKLLSG